MKLSDQHRRILRQAPRFRVLGFTDPNASYHDTEGSGTNECLYAVNKCGQWFTTGEVPYSDEFIGREWCRCSPDDVPDTIQYIGVYRSPEMY